MSQSLSQLLKQHGLTPNKGLGQHFLHDPQVALYIAQAARPLPDERVVEIGPGVGSLTLPLLREAGSVWAIERDRRLLPLLRARCHGHGRLEVREENALTVDFTALAAEVGGKLVVAANLPYNISTPILFHLLAHRQAIHRMVLMFQQEVAQRLAAPPGGKSYGVLTVQCGLWTRVEHLLDVPPSAFLPPPKVQSAVVVVTVRDTPAVPLPEPERFDQVVKAAFGQRRKTLGNALKTLHPDPAQWLAAAGIDPQRRGETLDLAEFARLAATTPRG